MPIRNIIFDWSGTLVDDLPIVLAATNFVFEKHGIAPMTLDQFRAEFCLPFTDFYKRFISIPLEELEGIFHGHIREAHHLVQELPHARDFLLFCRQQKLRTFLLSAVHADHYAAQVALNRFDVFLDRAYVGVWDKRAKILDVLRENQLDPNETLFIGDMQHDIETARCGGVFACAVLTGYNRLEQLRASDPDLIVAHLGELREILERDHFELRRVVLS
jgi:phosphoglycolate phosphatase